MIELDMLFDFENPDSWDKEKYDLLEKERFNLTKTFSSQSAIFSIELRQGPSELPCPGRSIDNTLKFLFEYRKHNIRYGCHTKYM